jgi:hypothetical protein
MTKLTQPQREELRYAVREQLVNAATVALTAGMLARRIERTRLLDFPVTEADVIPAVSMLVDLGQAKAMPAPLGATLYYQATAIGVLAHERGQ